MNELTLIATPHPDKAAHHRYASLVGLDDHKQQLLDELALILDPARFENWRRKHHPKGLGLTDAGAASSPLILLSGDVGCGKTALATSIATPLAELLDKRVTCLETPSDIRGGGRVGEVSLRITDAFAQAAARAGETGCGLLVLDEGDDLATSRAQLQAHHEDRAGLNVLIKQIDKVARDHTPLAVLLITNRAVVLDAAIMRRAALHLRFERPNGQIRRALFERILTGTKHDSRDIASLVKASEREVPYSFSDLTDRVVRSAIRAAWREDRPLDVPRLLAALESVTPTPLVDAGKHW